MKIQAHFLILGFTAALTTACAGYRSLPSAAQPASLAADGYIRDTHELLHGVLWMQTAAEFWALSQFAFDRAAQVLDRALADKNWTAALEQESLENFSGLPPALVMDLDETVLDNSQFEGQLVLDRTDYLPATWTACVDTAAAPAIPGAIDFIEAARTKDVRVIFVTNRTAAEEQKTVQNLDALLGTATDPDDVLCSGENQWASDKSPRRRYVAERYRILLLVGDDLNDFVSVSSAITPAERLALAKTNSTRMARPLGSNPQSALRVMGADPVPEVHKRRRDSSEKARHGSGIQELAACGESQFAEADVPDGGFRYRVARKRLRHGERRVAIDATICPELKAGLSDAISLLQFWWTGGPRPAVTIEARATGT